MKINCPNVVIGLIIFLTPSFSFAAGNMGFDGLNTLILGFANGVVRSTGYMMFTLAVVAFFFGIVQFIWSARQGSEGKGIQRGTQFMKWGLIAIFVMFSVWGIVKFAQGVFGIQGDNTIIVPSLNFIQSGGGGGVAGGGGGISCNPPNTIVSGICKTPSGTPIVPGGSIVFCNSPNTIINSVCTTPAGTPVVPSVADGGGPDIPVTEDIIPDTPTVPANELADIATSIADNGLLQNENIPAGERKYAYAINGSELGALIENTDIKEPDEALNKTLWGMFVVSNPPEVINKISRFEVYPNDHKGDYGFVSRKDQPNGKWMLGVYISIHLLKGNKELDTAELYATFLHEGMHIMTKGAYEQIDTSQKLPCSTYTILDMNDDLACLSANSYLVSFINTFWRYDPETNKAESLYRDKAFVSEYASTQPSEDIAETYATFVAKNRPTDNTIASQKVLFFYNFSELVSLRSNVRNRIGLEASSRGSDTDNDGVSNVIENAIGTNQNVDDVNDSSSSVQSPYYGMTCITNDADGNILNGTYDMSGSCQGY